MLSGWHGFNISVAQSGKPEKRNDLAVSVINLCKVFCDLTVFFLWRTRSSSKVYFSAKDVTETSADTGSHFTSSTGLTDSTNFVCGLTNHIFNITLNIKLL